MGFEAVIWSFWSEVECYGFLTLAFIATLQPVYKELKFWCGLRGAVLVW